MSQENVEGAAVAVLDASALLAYLQEEPGADLVADAIADSIISSVNLAEVLQKCIANDINSAGLVAELEALGLRNVPFSGPDAQTSAEIWPVTKSVGLSLADRACLALAKNRGLTVYTADREWMKVAKALAVNVRVIR